MDEIILDSSKEKRDRQIKLAQRWVDMIAETRPEAKGKVVVGVEPTENWNEVLMQFSDGTNSKLWGAVAVKILAGKVEESE